MAFPAAAGYALLILTNLVYNNFGGDAAGIQFFYASPVRFSQIVLAKNLTHATILVLEMALAWVAVPQFALVWLAAHWVISPEPFSSGPVSPSHAAFGQKCNTCHTGVGGVYFRPVTEKACLGCHDAPPHHASSVLFTPTVHYGRENRLRFKLSTLYRKTQHFEK